ncbi:MAG: aspartate kinase [Bacteroidia bacterium]
MKVFKFGGASVKDAAGVKNVAKILTHYKEEKILVVVSAMGKTTNMLEKVAEAFYHKNADVAEQIKPIREYHLRIMNELFSDKNNSVYDTVNNVFAELEWATDGEPTKSYDFEYDQIVSIGEIIATRIVSAYLNETGLQNQWLDARDYISTDDTWRNAAIHWEMTENSVQQKLLPLFLSGKTSLVVTQGFIGVTSENYTTTLGREGSDFTAAIFAHTLPANDVTIWKDVPGVLNADPKWFDDTVLLDKISYRDAIELAWFGTSVIHPKTIQPLQNKNIPLYVKSFIEPEKTGTIVSNTENPLQIPSFIYRMNQVLISIMSKDFSFIVEKNLMEIFKTFSEAGIKINIMQNTAISFSVSVDDDPYKIPALIALLQKDFKVAYNSGLELITIRNYDQQTIDRVTKNTETLLELKSRKTVQLLVKNLN